MEPTTSTKIEDVPNVVKMLTQKGQKGIFTDSTVGHTTNAHLSSIEPPIPPKTPNQKRYEDAADDVDAFFKTIYPIASKHTKHMLGKNPEKTELNLYVFRFLSLYMSIWSVMLVKKYR